MPLIETVQGVGIDPDNLVGKNYLASTTMTDGTVLPYFMAACRAYQVQTKQDLSAGQAAIDNGVAAANNAVSSTLGAAMTQATSTTSLTVGLGTRNLTVQTAKNFVVGMPVRIVSPANTDNRMDGIVTSYNSGTGALVVSVAGSNGSGTFASWNVFLIGSVPSGQVVAGGADATITTTATLTQSSSRVQPVNMAALGQSVILPDATTLVRGGPIFVVPNKGVNEFGIRDSTGALIGAVAALGDAECYLEDNSTPAGVWSIRGNNLQAGVRLGQFTFPNNLFRTQTVPDTVTWLSDSLLLVTLRDISGQPYVAAATVSSTGITVGTPVLIRAVGATAYVLRLSATKAFIAISAASGNNAFNVTVSGTTCTVSTGAALGFGPDSLVFYRTQCASNYAVLGASSDFIMLPFASGGNLQAVVVNCSGTTPVVGTAVTIGNGTTDHPYPNIRELTTTTVFSVRGDNAGSNNTAACRILSVSGTTITGGTPVSLNGGGGVGTVSAVSSALPYVVLSSTQVVASWLTGASGIQAQLFGISGTTITASSVLSVETGMTVSTSSMGTNNRPLTRLTATTCLLSYLTGESTSVSRDVVLTAGAGTLSAGTIQYGVSSVSTKPGTRLPLSGNTYFSWNNDTVASGVDTYLQEVTVSGTTVSVGATYTVPDGENIVPLNDGGQRPNNGAGGLCCAWNNSRSYFVALRCTGSTVRFLGNLSINVTDMNPSAPVFAPATSRVAAGVQSRSIPQAAGTPSSGIQGLVVVEFIS